MAFRRRMRRGSSRKSFRRHSGSRRRNSRVTPMRGGFRI